jgi:serine/threonine protein phosphatase PrpC
MVRKANEDSCLNLPEKGIWAVADGMGGHEAGEIASRMITDALSQIQPPTVFRTFLATVEASLKDTNHRLHLEATKRNYRIMGSTVVALVALDDQAACLWVGDSRLYRLRDGQLKRITRDHSHVQELVDLGLLRPEEAWDHPLGNVITRAVGSEPELGLEIVEFPLQADDRYLLCTDGLSRQLRDSEMASILLNNTSRDAVKELVQLALERGGHDNITALVVHIHGGQ